MPNVPAAPEVIVNHREGFFWGPVWQLPRKNKMFSMVCCGKRGAGKSWSMIGLAELLDRDQKGNSRFSLERLCFSAARFSELLAQDWPIGSVIILDDSGIALYSRDAMSKLSREITKTLMAVRYKRYILLLSLPNFSFLDKSAQKMVDYYSEIKRIDYEKEETVAKIQRIQVNSYTGKIYRHGLTKPGFFNTTSTLQIAHDVPIPFISFDKPSKPIIKEYEASRRKFMDKRALESARSLRKLEEPKEARKTFKDVFPLAQKEVELLKDKTGNLNDSLIMLRYGIGLNLASLIKSGLNNS